LSLEISASYEHFSAAKKSAAAAAAAAAACASRDVGLLQ